MNHFFREKSIKESKCHSNINWCRYGISLELFFYSPKKETLQKTYKSAVKEINALNRKLDNLNQYLNRSSSVQQTNDRKMEKDKTTRWFCPSKKVYRIEVFHFVTIHLDMCSKLLLLFLLIFFFSRIFHLRFIMYCTPYLLCILMQFTHADV